MNNEEQPEELVYQYLREFRKYGDMLDHEQFEKIVAHQMGMDPTSDTFQTVQSQAEHLISEELEQWLLDKQQGVQEVIEEPMEATKPTWRDNVPDEETHYINVDFSLMEEDNDDDDLVLVGKQLDIQVFHLGDERN